MAKALKSVAKVKDFDTGTKDTSKVANGLADVLSDTYRLLIKSHIYHWNVEGPMFYPIHQLTETQYNNLFAATDELAERIRALGHVAPSKIGDVVGDHAVGETDGKMTAEEMIADLAEDHERVAHRLHALIETAEGANDPVTADLATARSGFHEKAAWMLRATLGK
ncbi:DNA starvation/stationary phase protection protein [Celeribacter arenosi]|uniref:Dps family protein n=1 Tax=Celeribacter arenosi TaxID=792649 RepID=A0ABP7JTL8_9RHOB